MNFLRWAIGILLSPLFFGFLLACSQGKDSSVAVGVQNQSSNQTDLQHSFECSVPNMLRGVMESIHFDGDRASEEAEPYVGAFSTKAITFEMQKGVSRSINLFEPIFFTSRGQGNHDACEAFKWYTAGPHVFVEFLGAGGNPYPPQQLLFMDEASQTFRPAEQLHPLLGEDFVEFEKKSGCLAGLRHRDGRVYSVCFQDSDTVLKNVFLQERYQADGHHEFLCDFSDGLTAIAEYSVKSNVFDETVEEDPVGSRQRMLASCDRFLEKFNKQVIPRR